MMMKFLLKNVVELTGNKYSSMLLKSFAQSRLSKPLIRPFAKTYAINLKEAEYPISHYQSLHDFFTRRLNNQVHTIDYSTNTLVSPTDAQLSDMGPISSKQRFYIKHQLYFLDEILGSSDIAKTYENGFFFIFYLSPRDYHRFHYPMTGSLTKRYALGEKSFPVNTLGTRLGQSPFSTNYRIVSELSTAYGHIAMIKIGALNINSIQLTNSRSKFNKGEELGYFSFGSTVLLLIEPNQSFKPLLKANTTVRVGQPIAKWVE